MMQRFRKNEEARARKKGPTEMQAVKGASLVDEETRQMRACDLAAGSSSSKFVDIERTTSEAANIDVDTTDGFTTIDGVGSEKPDPPSY